MHTRHKHTTSICMTNHSQYRKHNIHHTPTQTHSILQHSKAKKHYFQQRPLHKNIPTYPNTVTTTDMRHIHTFIVSMHLATRGNDKILRAPPPHISSSEEILSASLVAPLPNSEQINLPDKLSIFLLKYLGAREIEYITTCHIPAIWMSSLIIPIPKPGKDTSQGTSYRPIALLCPAAKVPESLLLPTTNKFLLPAQDQNGFRREHSTTSTLLQLTADIAVGFNQRKPPDRTVCVTEVDRRRSIQFAITTCYQRSTDLSYLRPRRDGSPVI